MAKEILIKPLITEKTENLSENLAQYSFVVNRKANKIEIRKAVEDNYNVTVEAVNTMVMPGKAKVRNTRSGLQRGLKPAYKKAVVTLSEGEEIDFFGVDVNVEKKTMPDYDLLNVQNLEENKPQETVTPQPPLENAYDALSQPVQQEPPEPVEILLSPPPFPVLLVQLILVEVFFWN